MTPQCAMLRRALLCCVQGSQLADACVTWTPHLQFLGGAPAVQLPESEQRIDAGRGATLAADLVGAVPAPEGAVRCSLTAPCQREVRSVVLHGGAMP